MWILGEGYGRNSIEVPTHYEFETGARDWQVDLDRGRDERGQPQTDWAVSEHMGWYKLMGDLWFKLGEHRAVAPRLACALVAFSARAHQHWWEAGGKHKPADSHFTRPADFVAGMISHFVGGIQGGPDWLRNPLEWHFASSEGAADRLAYGLWEARKAVCHHDAHGRHSADNERARWLLRMAERPLRRGPRNSEAFMVAIGTELFRDPRGTAAAFSA